MLQQGGGDLLDGHRAGVEEGDVLGAVHGLRRPYLVAALIDRGVAAVGAPLAADLLQPLRGDGEAEQAFPLGFEDLRQVG